MDNKFCASDLELVTGHTSSINKVSLIFLICNDSSSGLRHIGNIKHSTEKNEKDALFKQAIVEIMNEFQNDFKSVIIEALEIMKCFKICRLLGNQTSSPKKYLKNDRVQLYLIADKLTSQQTKDFVKYMVENTSEYGECVMLEEYFLTWDAHGIIQLNTDYVSPKLKQYFVSSLSPHLNFTEPKEEIQDSIPNIISAKTPEGTEYYPILDQSDLGYCVIINQKSFTRNETVPEHLPSTHLTSRQGSEKDVKNLSEIFTNFGFRVRVHVNVTLDQLRVIFSEYAKVILPHHSFLTLVFMSHGNEEVVYTSDSVPVRVEALEMAFQRDRCPQLVGKPKILIIQACQGNNLQRLLNDDVIAGDASENFLLGPERGDALIAWSTVKGYASVRDPLNGSWFIQELCKELERSAAERDLVDIITRVNCTLRGKTRNGVFMVPALSTSLCKKVRFTSFNDIR